MANVMTTIGNAGSSGVTVTSGAAAQESLAQALVEQQRRFDANAAQ